MASIIPPSPTRSQQRSELDLENRDYNHSASQSFELEPYSANQDPNSLIVRDEKPEWVSGVKLYNIVAAVTLVCLLMLLDSSIIVTAVPRITSDFHSLPDVGWYGSAYQLARYAVVTYFVDWLVDMVLAQRFNHLPESFI